MVAIEQLIKESINPFDNVTAHNFWEKIESFPTVNSIHQNALISIKSTLDQVSQDHKTRTILLYGDPGVGKTHFLKRLKKTLNDQAFFVYIEPFPASDHIWRHILRYTVDSLVNAPAGKNDSQLILWLKGCLSTIEKELQSEQQSLINRIKGFFGKIKTEGGGERKAFIDILKQSIGTQGIYNANDFFGVLYDLTNPDLYFLACEWLKGDSLDE
jgi:GTPase SAR1 family protein